MDFNAVHHDFNVVSLVAVHHHPKLDFAHHTIHTNTGEACLTNVFEQFAVVAFSGSDRWRQNDDAPTVKFFEDQVGDLLLGVTHHAFARIVGIGLAYSCVEQAQEVVDLSDGAHCGAWVFVHALLLNADDRAEACDLVYIRTFHVADELSRVCRETLHITALSLGIDGVEGQRRLAASADAGDDYEGVARDR